MIGKTRVGLKYFFWGMVIGILFAPGSGKETRAKLLDDVGTGFLAMVAHGGPRRQVSEVVGGGPAHRDPELRRR